MTSLVTVAPHVGPVVDRGDGRDCGGSRGARGARPVSPEPRFDCRRKRSFLGDGTLSGRRARVRDHFVF